MDNIYPKHAQIQKMPSVGGGGGGPYSVFLVVNVFHRGHKDSPGDSVGPKGVQLLLDGGSFRFFYL